MPNYIVGQGDCILSLAAKHGFTWETVWNHPENAQLKQVRKNPTTLLPGDTVVFPEKNGREETGQTSARHRFRLKPFLVTLRLRLLDGTEPRPDEAYSLDVEGRTYKGRTDEDGALEVSIPPTTGEAWLKVGELGDEVYRLDVGHIGPIDTLLGVQQRLLNLGYDPGPADGVNGPLTRAAVRAFQAAHRDELEVDGIAGAKTQDKLAEVYGH